MKTLINNGEVVLPSQTVKADILLEGEKVAQLGQIPSSSSVDRVIDAKRKTILPGLVDPHVHLPWRMGGMSSFDDPNSGTYAGIHGGVTTVIDFAIPRGEESASDAVHRRIDEFQGESHSDFGLHSVINYLKGELQDTIAELVDFGVSSFKLYLLYPGLQLDDGQIYRIMDMIGDCGGTVCFHAENGEMIDSFQETFIDRGNLDPFTHYLSSPPVVESEAIGRLIHFQAHTDVETYFVHVSSGGSLKKIREAKTRGQTVHAETCPHYLLLTSQSYQSDNGHRYLVNPTLKEKEDNQALWESIHTGTLDTIATDHCAFSKGQKDEQGNHFQKVPKGLPGIETRLPLLVYHGYRERGVSLQKLVNLMSYKPARMFNLYPKKGTLLPGSDADLVILDPTEDFSIQNQDLHMEVGWTPFEGFKGAGRPETVIRRGEILLRDGEWTDRTARGKFLPRKI